MPQSRPASINAGTAVSLPHAARGRLLAAATAIIVVTAAPSARADALSRGAAALDHGDYIRAARDLMPLAEQGNPRALGLVGFMYEHGFGVPQAYPAAFDFYCRGAIQGNPFAQAMLGLMYDKGHGVHQDFIQAYKWLDLAAARSSGRERDVYARFRDAIASRCRPMRLSSDNDWF